MSDQWFYFRGETKSGPYSILELKDLATAGKIELTDSIWRDGLNRPVPAAKVKGLFPPGTEPTSEPSGAEASPSVVETAGPGVKSEQGATTGPTPEPADPSGTSPVLATPSDPAVPAATASAPKKPQAPKKGRAMAVRGAQITAQDGATVYFCKICIKCGHRDTAKSRLPIRNGITRLGFFCPKCRKLQPVEIQGVM